MRYSTIKNIKEQLEEIGIDDWREVINQMDSLTDDFEVDDYRIINDKSIDEIQQNELSSDEYVLGSFNANFLANVLDIDVDAIEAMQKADAYEAIGKLIISLDKIEELQDQYVDADGYGHHFAHYDHEEHEVSFTNDNGSFDNTYYVFRIN